MSGYKARITTINALLAGSSLYLTHQNDIQDCIDEFDKVVGCATINNRQRKDILQIFHSSRATDGFLKTFVFANGCDGASSKTPNTMGAYLHCLAKHNSTSCTRLPLPQRTYYQQHIVNIRNEYLHRPNLYPSIPNSTVSILLNDMQSCVATVISL